ncbi:hypothetical protein NQ314_007577 [Rhamnusium bicolor]|uniref:Uncharacterized protein n=1 Tax=Rhamnusium bicolor TaxID=1586634 RepID=A0AAV8YKG6_9CUCU|nr:hypothetical protein NQ314_007577 [Rhamnusium bicolor]
MKVFVDTMTRVYKKEMGENYFKELGERLKDVPPANIINYDESNFWITREPKKLLSIAELRMLTEL